MSITIKGFWLLLIGQSWFGKFTIFSSSLSKTKKVQLLPKFVFAFVSNSFLKLSNDLKSFSINLKIYH